MKKNFNNLFIKFATALKNTPYGKMIPSSDNELAHGFCFYWGYVFCKVYGGKCVTICELNKAGNMYCLSPHMLVKIKNKYYDGDYPLGTDYIPQLSRKHTIIVHDTPEEAMIFWKKKSCLKQFDKVVDFIKSEIEKI